MSKYFTLTPEQVTTLLGQLAIGIGVLVTIWRQRIDRQSAKDKEDRERMFQREDRAAAKQEIIDNAKAEAEATRIKNEVVAESLRLQHEALALQLRQEQQEATKNISKQIAEVHDVATTAVAEAKTAYKEANDVNLKILSVGIANRGVDSRTRQLDNIESTAKETNEIVKNVEAAVVETVKT